MAPPGQGPAARTQKNRLVAARAVDRFGYCDVYEVWYVGNFVLRGDRSSRARISRRFDQSLPDEAASSPPALGSAADGNLALPTSWKRVAQAPAPGIGARLSHSLRRIQDDACPSFFGRYGGRCCVGSWPHGPRRGTSGRSRWPSNWCIPTQPRRGQGSKAPTPRPQTQKPSSRCEGRARQSATIRQWRRFTPSWRIGSSSWSIPGSKQFEFKAAKPADQKAIEEKFKEIWPRPGDAGRPAEGGGGGLPCRSEQG